MTATNKTIVLDWTTSEQLDLVKGLLTLAHEEASEQMMAYPNPNDVPKDILDRWNALQNICSDLGVPGFEMSNVPETYIPKSIPVDEIDNRDFRTTWLWITLPDGKRAYVEVDPFDLLEVSVENLGEDADTSDLQALADYLNGELNRRS